MCSTAGAVQHSPHLRRSAPSRAHALSACKLGPAAEQARDPPSGLTLHDPMSEVTDFADTAAIIANLDVVVSVDTSVVHLAGAMGKPVLLLDRYDNCWRWLSGRTDSPWYPSCASSARRSSATGPLSSPTSPRRSAHFAREGQAQPTPRHSGRLQARVCANRSIAMSETPSKPLAGRTALITGSGQNIGRAIALAFAQQGANVVLNGHRNQAAIDAVAAEVRAFGVGALAVLADVADAAAVQAMVDQAIAEFGAVDISVSNASVRLHTPFLDISLEEWQRIINSNLNASFYLARAVIPGMQQRGWGRIIHISGRDGFMPIANRVHNITCKAGVYAMAKALAIEFGPFGITANTVAPGVIDTTRDLTQYPQFRDGYGERVKSIPVRRVGHVDEIAAACCYLAGDAGGFVTGQVIHVNGGDVM